MEEIQKDKKPAFRYAAPDFWVVGLTTKDVVMESQDIGNPGSDNEGETIEW